MYEQDAILAVQDVHGHQTLLEELQLTTENNNEENV
jgi:hypothetical protein